MAHYINYYFKKVSYTDEIYVGEFSAPDNDVFCEFLYDRQNETIEIWNNNKPKEEILPLPIHWLDMKLEQNGKLNENESKISY